MNLTVIIVSVLAFFLIISTLIKKDGHYENYYDLVPYDYHWAIFKCYTMDCVKNKSWDCYKFCRQLGEPGATKKCRTRCLDYADIQAEQLRLNDYNFSYILPKFNDYTITNNYNQNWGSYLKNA